MPFYDYRCKEPTCDHQWEVEQKLDEPRLTECPVCKRATAERQVATGTMTKFKGKWFKNGGY